MGKRKKLLGLVLVVCMLFTLTPITSRADVTTEKWTDFTAADFAGSSGTKDDPYQIATAGQLAKLASEVNSGVPEQTHLGEYFKLTAPIDLSGKRWIPIGYGNAQVPKLFQDISMEIIRSLQAYMWMNGEITSVLACLVS